MDLNEKVLVLFTSEYPYGIVAETFLETEIQYLCKGFDKVIIIPSSKLKFIRAIPSNAFINNIVCENNKKLGLFGLLMVIFFFLKTVFGENKPLLYFKHFKDVFFVLRQERRKYKALKLFIKTVPSNAVFYDYWYINSTLPLVWLKRKKLIRTFICRAHAYDLYDDRSFAGIIPFRNYIVRYIDQVFFISVYGMSYFKQRVPEKLHTKLRLSYLGVETAKPVTHNNQLSDIIIISIARLMPFKHVEKIASVLNHFKRPVNWVHFGGGEEFQKLEKACKEINNPLVKWKLMGQVDNSEVENFIIRTKVSACITLSTSEGLPVSIMEVIRYGIPVLATKLPSMGEIINSNIGVLVELDESPEDIARKLDEICNWTEDKRQSIVAFFETNFNAHNNYVSFVNQLLTIRDKKYTN